jgi:hypothetical protein
MEGFVFLLCSWIIYRSGSRAIDDTETGDRENAARKTEQGLESEVGRTGDCSEDQDQGHHFYAGE